MKIKNKMVRIGTISMLILSAQMMLLGSLLPEIAREYSLNYAQRGLIPFVGSIAFALSALISTFVYSKVQYSKAIGGYFLLSGIATFAMPFVDSLVAVTLLIAVVSFVSGAAQGGLIVFIDSADKENAVYNVNHSQTFFAVGAIFSPIIIGIMLTIGISWSNIYLISSFLYFAIGAVYIKLPENHSELKSLGFNKDRIMRLLQDKKTLILIAAVFCYTGAEGSASTWMTSFMQESMNLSVIGSAFSIAIFWLGISIGRYISSELTKYVSTNSQIISWSLFSVVTTIANGVFADTNSSSSIMTWLMAGLMGLSYSGIWSLIVSKAVEYHPNDVELITPIMIFSGSIGIAIVSWLIGIIAENQSPATAMYFRAIFFAAIVVLIAILSSLEKKDKVSRVR